MRSSLAVVMVFAICALPLFASSKQQQARGAAVFASAGCQHCHTIGNEGGNRGPNLSDVGKRTSQAAIRNQIVNGSNAMPKFGDALDSGQIDDLVAYLKSCRHKPNNHVPAP